MCCVRNLRTYGGRGAEISCNETCNVNVLSWRVVTSAEVMFGKLESPEHRPTQVYVVTICRPRYEEDRL
jgi:hypothetical protein